MVDKSLLTQEMKAGLFSAESLSVTVKNEQRGEEIKKTAEQVIPEEERKADVVHPSTWAETVGRKYDHQEKEPLKNHLFRKFFRYQIFSRARTSRYAFLLKNLLPRDSLRSCPFSVKNAVHFFGFAVTSNFSKNLGFSEAPKIFC